MIVMGCNQMDDFDYWDDDTFYLDDAHSQGKAAIIVSMVIIALFMLLVLWSEYKADTMYRSENINDNNIATVYDTPSGNLVEHEEKCPECGMVSMAVNNEIVCRNEDCPNYGIAVPIDFY